MMTIDIAYAWHGAGSIGRPDHSDVSGHRRTLLAAVANRPHPAYITGVRDFACLALARQGLPQEHAESG
jgi:hypothetical protein